MLEIGLKLAAETNNVILPSQQQVAAAIRGLNITTYYGSRLDILLLNVSLRLVLSLTLAFGSVLIYSANPDFALQL